MATTTLENFRLDFPEFSKDNPRFQSPLTTAEETAFERFITRTAETFNLEPFDSYSTDTQSYILHLYIAHVAELSFLPRHGKIPQMVFGDQSSASVSEGAFSATYNRINYDEFMTDPYLSITAYGSELAHYIRKSLGFKGFVL